jgi:hypothetical protein
MLHTTEIAAARAALGADGGWLLDLGDGHYLVTGDPGTVAELRDKSFIDLCEVNDHGADKITIIPEDSEP